MSYYEQLSGNYNWLHCRNFSGRLQAISFNGFKLNYVCFLF